MSALDGLIASDTGIANTPVNSSLTNLIARDSSIPSENNTVDTHEGMTHTTSSNPNPPTVQNFAGNLVAGAVKGASQIGNTLLTPAMYAAQKFGMEEPRQATTNVLKDLGADPNSLPYQGGELGAEIAGTAAVPSILAKGADAIPALAKYAPKLASSIASGGFNLGNTGGNPLANALTRATGGAIVGGTTAGMVDPSQAVKGAEIGAVTPLAVKAAGMVGSGIKNLTGRFVQGALGTTTGTSGATIEQAYKAGQNADPNFVANMRGQVPFDDVVAQAKAGLQQMRIDRGNAYRNGMAQISNDKTILDGQPIADAINNLKANGQFKGQVINKNAADTVQELADQVNNWAKLPPAEFHTPEGFDALKKAIGDIRDTTQYGTQSRVAADTVYNAIKNQITQQAPVYASVMKDYSKASDTLNEVTKGLSLGDKASNDMAVRKLQSLLRNNAQTNYGNRLNLASTLQDQGGVSLMPAIAGQGLNSWMPRGLVGAGEKGAGVMAAILHPASILPMAAAAPVASPRLMGEAAYGAGRLSGVTGQAINKVLSKVTPNMLQGPSGKALAEALMTSVPSLMLSH